MAIKFPDQEAKYVDAVLATRERNYYDDSDFYAVVWDEKSQAVINVEYATTRVGGGGSAWVDATPEVIEKAKAYFAPHIAKGAITESQLRYEKQVKEFKEFHTGTPVRVKRQIKSRKQGVIPEGFTGILVWQGSGYGYNSPPQYGVKNVETGQCFFVSGKDLEYAGPEPTGDEVMLPLTMENDYERILKDVTEQFKHVTGHTLGRYNAVIHKPSGIHAVM